MNLSKHPEYTIRHHGHRMDSQDNNTFIRGFHQEAEHIKRVLHALEAERDQSSQAFDLPQAKTDSSGTQLQSYDADSFEETLVSDGTLGGSDSDASDASSDSDSDSIIYPRRCGTPCSAPPTFSTTSYEIPSFSYDVTEATHHHDKQVQRERRSSLPSLKIPRDDFNQGGLTDYSDKEDFKDETSVEEEYEILFPNIDHIHVETLNPWCTISPGGFPRRPRPRQRAEDVYLSFSSLWEIMQSPEPGYLSSIQICDQVTETSEIQVVAASNLSSDVLMINVNDTLVHMPPLAEYSSNETEVTVQYYTEEEHSMYEINLSEELSEIVNSSIPIAEAGFMAPSTNPYFFDMPKPRYGCDKYTRRIFNPSLPVIPETGDFLISFSTLIPFTPAAPERAVLSIDERRRSLPDLDFTSPSKEKKSWFDMVMEDEDDCD